MLEYSDRSLLRAWLQENHSREKECWVVVSRSKTPPPGILRYIDLVEEALCFRWIDSTLKKHTDGRLAQRLSPRRKKSHWTRRNMDIRRLPYLSDKDVKRLKKYLKACKRLTGTSERIRPLDRKG